jgi:hypothetical protein
MAAGKLVTYKDSGERLEYIAGINKSQRIPFKVVPF